jgi:hypothetical protein
VEKAGLNLRRMRIAFLAAFIFAPTCTCENGEVREDPLPNEVVDAGQNGGTTDGGNGGASSDAGPNDAGPPPGDPQWLVVFGENLPPALPGRIEALIRGAAPHEVVVGVFDTLPPILPEGSVILSFGNTRVSSEVIDGGTLAGLGSEGFVVKSGVVQGTPTLAADGNVIAPDPFGHGSLGAAYGAYALLESLGFAFLHPLAPTLPSTLSETLPEVDRAESPHWPIRGLQLHTMHPLELTDLLNGWGPAGPDDEAGWQAMLPDWDRYLEWSLANRQNRVHWVLLWAQSWAEFGDGQTRLDRLTQIIDQAHAWGIWVGADVPIALEQQHTFRLLRTAGTLEEEVAEIESRVDWLMQAGFDYLATESGFSEFTHPDDLRMVAWMDALATHMNTAHNRETFIKVHISTGQTGENYTDPDTGDPLNFNFLPHYAVPELGVMPHTVQHYALDDLAPTYGNDNFAHMREFLHEEAGARPVVWHPETAYWVSFDIDVPLFLPLYLERRFHDLRLLAQDEIDGVMGRGEHAGGRMDGQITFSSGWEWGYWLNDVVTARAAWDPRMDIADETEALRDLLSEVFAHFGPVKQNLVDWMVDYAATQKLLLIDGRVDGQAPAEIEKRNGQAYLQGWETWDEVSENASLAGFDATTQPSKLGLVQVQSPFILTPDYPTEIDPLLDEMDQVFDLKHQLLAQHENNVPEPMRDLYDDLLDSAHITALRATQVHGLYDFADGSGGDAAWGLERLATARTALDDAALLVAEREAAYRVPADRIAAWRENPTAYEFTYLWTVRSLHYWWRDEGKAVDAPNSPCYMNLMAPVDIAFGEGVWHDVSVVGRAVLEDVLGLGWAGECLAPPMMEPAYPQDDLRSRP